MALILKDRIKESTTTSGTGTYTLGGAETGFEAFSQIGDANTTYYCCTDGVDFEVGIGTYTLSGTTLVRTTILQSSNSDAAVSWNAGATRIIFCTQPAEKAAFLDASNQLVINGTSVTSTSAELNILDGVTASAAELNILDGVTASAADINLIDGITNGTVIASKALIADANIDITGGRNITITGELDAGSLDISGDADIDGTLEADAITINGVTLSETIADTVGAMVTSNTESGITVAYDDADNTLDFTVGTLNQDTTGNAATATALETARTIGGTSFDGTANIAVGLADTATALATARTIHGVSFDGTANIDLSEVVSDTVGAMVSSNTETGITVTYQDADNTIDFEIGAGAIVNSMLADDAVGADELAASAVVTASIVDANVTTAKIATDAITEAKIADNAVQSEHINDNVISGQTSLASGIADADELLISDAGSIKRTAMSVIKTYIGAADDATALAIALG
jgi:hypothetical protein